jgi:prefoldin subunit 5
MDIEIKTDNTEPRIFDSYDEMIKRLKDDVKNLKKIKKQQKKILKLEEKRKEVLNDIERKKEIERKLKERDRKRHRKH